MRRPGAILVEGEGELGAADNLIARLHPGPWRRAARWTALHTAAGRRKAAERYRHAGLGALLLLRDEDDACPRETGPRDAAEIAALQLPFPVATVLLKSEFEVLFLPCLATLAGESLAGRPGLLAGTTWDGATWESRRGVKEWLSAHFPPGKRYKPTLDQLPLTRLLDLPTLRAADVPCFGTLERALAFLDAHWEAPGGVYPPPPIPLPPGSTH